MTALFSVMILDQIERLVNGIVRFDEVWRLVPSMKPFVDDARAKLVATGQMPAPRSASPWAVGIVLGLCLAAACWALWLLFRKKRDP